MTAIDLVFRRFDEMGTIHQTQCSMVDDGLQVPVLRGARHRVTLEIPSYQRVRRILANPMYAGAYTFGASQTEESIDRSQKVVKRKKPAAREDWHALIPDHHEGYISWNTYESNQRRIAENRRGPTGRGAPREGEGLLQGLILCGRCGRRMHVNYGKGQRADRYTCAYARKQLGQPVCQAFGAVRLQSSIEKLVLEVLQPAGVEAMILAARKVVEIGDAERAHWRQQVERAQYEITLATRQYDCVDPANRLVAAELERRLENAMRSKQIVEREAEAHLRRLEPALRPGEDEQLREYARNISTLWNDAATRAQDRKRVLRCLIRNVVVLVPKKEEPGNVRAEVHWSGGEVTVLEVARAPHGGNHHQATPEDILELVRKLATEFSDAQIALILSNKGYRSPTGLAYTRARVGTLRFTHGIDVGPRVHPEGEDVYSLNEAAKMLGANPSTVTRWLHVGLLRGSLITPGAP